MARFKEELRHFAKSTERVSPMTVSLLRPG